MTIPTEHVGLWRLQLRKKFATTRVHSTLGKGWVSGAGQGARYSGIIIMVYPAIGIYRDMQGDIGIYTYIYICKDI